MSVWTEETERSVGRLYLKSAFVLTKLHLMCVTNSKNNFVFCSNKFLHGSWSLNKQEHTTDTKCIAWGRQRFLFLFLRSKDFFVLCGLEINALPLISKYNCKFIDDYECCEFCFVFGKLVFIDAANLYFRSDSVMNSKFYKTFVLIPHPINSVWLSFLFVNSRNGNMIFCYSPATLACSRPCFRVCGDLTYSKNGERGLSQHKKIPFLFIEN